MDTRPLSADAPRRIRVFVSSTFRDMREEREILIKKIFPQLRSRCEQRAVTWTEVDLRWGITDEQLAGGQLLPLCLAEIGRCRPYFIGILGERYGFVPDQIDPALEEEYPWLQECGGRSLTELECLHGVLNEPAEAPHAFFYFRDPAYAKQMTAAGRSDFASESPEAAARLARLKERIRNAYRDGQLRNPPFERYADPEALGARVLADLTRVIDERYPASTVPDFVARSRREHDAFARSHRRGYVPRPAYLAPLDNYATGSGTTPFVVIGGPGSGKTALLSEWADAFRMTHPQHVVITHFVGATRDSADWVELTRRLMHEIHKALAIPREVPATTDSVRDQFSRWLSDAARSGRTILVLDALDQLGERDSAPDLGWLPATVPLELKLIVSTSPGRTLEALTRRGWTAPASSLLLAPFDEGERQRALRTFLGLYHKTLSHSCERRLIEAPQCANPLFLHAVLDELRQFGTHEALEARVDSYLQAGDLTTLFATILDRWVDDFSGDCDVVRRSLCFVAASRRGLAEGELIDLLGTRGVPLPLVQWTPFALAAEGALVNRSGRLTFAHAALRAAVHARWLDRPGAMDDARRELVTFFREVTALGDRSVDELPWLLAELQDWRGLADVLTDIPAFLLLRQPRREWELHRYWTRLGSHGNAVDAYAQSLARWISTARPDEATVRRAVNQLAIFHYDRHEYAAAEPLMRRVASSADAAPDADRAELATSLTNLAQLLAATGRRREAEPLMRQALDISERSAGPDAPEVAACLNNLGQLLADTTRPGEGEPLLRRAAAIWERSLGMTHPKVAIALNNLGELLEDTGRLAEAEETLRRSLAIGEQCFGPDDPRLAITIHNLGRVLGARERLKEGESLLRRALLLDERTLGPVHSDVGRDLCTLGSLLFAAGRLEEAEAVLTRALAVCRSADGPEHPKVAVALNNLGAVLYARNRLSEAEPLLRDALRLHRATLDADDPAVANDMNTLAAVLQAAGRLDEAEPLHRRHLELLLANGQKTGHRHPKLQVAIDNYVNVLTLKGIDEAEIVRRVTTVADSYGEHVDPRSNGAPAPRVEAETAAPPVPLEDGRFRPLQTVTTLVDIATTDGFLASGAGDPFDRDGRHAKARLIGMAIDRRGGRVLMRSIFDAVASRVGPDLARQLDGCWSGIGNWSTGA